MTDLQKLIKGAAIVLAVILVITIIGGIVKAFAGISWLLGDRDSDLAGENKVYTLSQTIHSLQIDIGAAELSIQIGEAYKLESNHRKLTVTDKDGVLCIREEKGMYGSFGGNYNGVKLTLTIPHGKVLKLAHITTGAGKVSVERLEADDVELEFGAGEVTIDYLYVKNKADIQTGAGKVTVKDGFLHDLDLEMGVGELSLMTALGGENHIEQGVGQLNLVLKLLGGKDTYSLRVNKGIGSIHINGEAVTNGSVYGSGDTKVYIDGGIGAIDIRLQDSENS